LNAYDHQAAITVCGKRKAGLDVARSQIGKVGQHLRDSHAASQIIKHICDRNAGAANAWLAAPNERVDDDALAVVHPSKVWKSTRQVKATTEEFPGLGAEESNVLAEPRGPPQSWTTPSRFAAALALAPGSPSSSPFLPRIWASVEMKDRNNQNDLTLYGVYHPVWETSHPTAAETL